MLKEELTSHPRWDDFLAFHDLNPDVFEWLLDEAHEARRRGYRLSGRYLFERLRAEGPVEIDGLPDEKFVMSNDFVALYTRTLIYEDPSLEAYLETRPVKRADGESA